MTATAHQMSPGEGTARSALPKVLPPVASMSAPLVADPGVSDGPATVAPPAPFARVVEAHRPGHHCRLFFVASKSDPSSWRRVDYTLNESIECSCPRGRVLGPVTGKAKLCRHLTAVVELLMTERSAATF